MVPRRDQVLHHVLPVHAHYWDYCVWLFWPQCRFVYFGLFNLFNKRTSTFLFHPAVLEYLFVSPRISCHVMLVFLGLVTSPLSHL